MGSIGSSRKTLDKGQKLTLNLREIDSLPNITAKVRKGVPFKKCRLETNVQRYNRRKIPEIVENLTQPINTGHRLSPETKQQLAKDQKPCAPWMYQHDF